MIQRTDEFPFRTTSKKYQSKYGELLNEFLESNEKRMAWKCTTKNEAKLLYQSLRGMIASYGIGGVSLYINTVKFCVGLERK